MHIEKWTLFHISHLKANNIQRISVTSGAQWWVDDPNKKSNYTRLESTSWKSQCIKTVNWLADRNFWEILMQINCKAGCTITLTHLPIKQYTHNYLTCKDYDVYFLNKFAWSRRGGTHCVVGPICNIFITSEGPIIMMKYANVHQRYYFFWGKSIEANLLKIHLLTEQELVHLTELELIHLTELELIHFLQDEQA